MFIVDHPLFQTVKHSLVSFYSTPLVVILFSVFLLIATITDIKSTKIPNVLNVAFLITRLLLIPFIGISIWDILGAIFAFVALMIPAMIKMHNMGGDIKCLTVVGLYVGLAVIPFYLLLTCAYFIVYAGICVVLKKKVGNVPFAPFFFLSHVSLLLLTVCIF